MSTVRALNAGPPGAGTTTNLMSGLAKAWCNYKGTTTRAVRASLNISSVTEVGNGDYTFNFANVMANANYAIPGMAGIGGTATGDNATAYVGLSRRSGTPLANSVRLAVNFVDGTGGHVMNSNPDYLAFSVQGDLA